MRNVTRKQLKKVFGVELPDCDHDGEFAFALVELHEQQVLVISSRYSGESEVVDLRTVLALAVESDLQDGDEPESADEGEYEN